MMRITVVVPDLSRLTRGVQERVDRAVGEATEAAVNDAKASMSAEKSGRIYRRGKVAHQASAPGEAPAIDTSELVNSVHATRLAPMRWALGAGAEYAVHLEYGTARMAPRPFLRPAAERARPVLRDKVAEALKP